MSRSFLRGASMPAALGSLVSLAAQALMALLLLRLYEPAAVGTFSVVAQTAFGWATLALSQSPTSLLANQHLPAMAAAQQSWHISLRRWLWLVPLAFASLGWSQIHHTDVQNTATSAGGAGMWVLLFWAAGISLSQMAWLLAQSLSLRIHGPWSIAAVRMLPPVLSAGLAGMGAYVMDWRSSQALLAAALAGYLAGAGWLNPVLRARTSSPPDPSAPEPTALTAGDTRSERLKLAHTLSDVFVATALATQWASVHGPAQAGFILVLLRVLGFIPALVSSAWAQVVLSRPQASRPSSVVAAAAGAAGVLGLALLVQLAIARDWLSPNWQGLQIYLWPMAFWQACAGLMAAVSHRPLRLAQAHAFTWQCLSINAGQALLLFVPAWLGWQAEHQLWALTAWMGGSLLAQAFWAARLR